MHACQELVTCHHLYNAFAPLLPQDSGCCPLQDVVTEVPAAKELFDKASDILSYDLLKICTEGEQYVTG